MTVWIVTQREPTDPAFPEDRNRVVAVFGREEDAKAFAGEDDVVEEHVVRQGRE